MPLKRCALALFVLLPILACPPLSARAEAVEDIRVGYRAYDARNYDEAQRLFARALEDRGLAAKAQAAAYNGLGMVLVAKLQFERAIKEYGNAIKANPDYADAYMNRGNAYGCMNDYDTAVKDYDQAIRLSPGYALAYRNRGVTNSRRGNQRKALEDYGRAIALAPNDAKTYAYRAFAHKVLGNQRESWADARRAKELDPGSVVPPFE